MEKTKTTLGEGFYDEIDIQLILKTFIKGGDKDMMNQSVRRSSACLLKRLWRVRNRFVLKSEQAVLKRSILC